MAAHQPAFVPLLNPDSRPLPAGWTQHYDPSRKLWIYLDMNVLPPRATLTHPAGTPLTPARRGGQAARPDVTETPPWPDTPVPNVPYRNAIQAHRERHEKTLAQQLYSSAMPRVMKKESLDEFGMRRDDSNMDEVAPSYGSVVPNAYNPLPIPPIPQSAPAVPQPSTTPTLPPRTPGRRPLPQPPGAPSVNQLAYSGPPPPAPPPPLPQPVQQPHPQPNEQPEIPLQPTPTRPAFIEGGNVVSLADTLHQAIPNTQSPDQTGVPSRNADIAIRAKPPSYSTATRPPHLRHRSRPSNDVPQTATSATFHYASSDTSRPPENAIMVTSRPPTANGNPVISRPPTANPSPCPSPSPSPSPAPSSQQPASASHSPNPSRHSHLSPVLPSLSESSASPALSPNPSSGGATLASSAPTTPEPAQQSLAAPVPQFRKAPRDSFAPPQIVALANRHLKSASVAQIPEAFDPATLYCDSSRPTSQKAPSSLQHRSTEDQQASSSGSGRQHGDTLAVSARSSVEASSSGIGARSSMSGYVNISSSSSASGTGQGQLLPPPSHSHSQQPHHLRPTQDMSDISYQDPDLVEPPSAHQASSGVPAKMKAKDGGKSKLRMFNGFGFSSSRSAASKAWHAVSGGGLGLGGSRKAGMASTSDLLTGGVVVTADAVGKVIDEGFRSNVSGDVEPPGSSSGPPRPAEPPQRDQQPQRRPLDLSFPSMTQLHSRMRIGTPPLELPKPLQPQDTNATIRPSEVASYLQPQSSSAYQSQPEPAPTQELPALGQRRSVDHSLGNVASSYAPQRGSKPLHKSANASLPHLPPTAPEPSASSRPLHSKISDLSLLNPLQRFMGSRGRQDPLGSEPIPIPSTPAPEYQASFVPPLAHSLPPAHPVAPSETSTGESSSSSLTHNVKTVMSALHPTPQLTHYTPQRRT